MHEVSICQSIISTLESELDDRDLANVREIHLKVGILSCIEPALLKHVFGFMVVDTPFQNSELNIDLVDVLARCENCGQSFKVENYKFICPDCGKPSSKIIEGNELQIHKIILEEPAHEEINQ